MTDESSIRIYHESQRGHDIPSYPKPPKLRYIKEFTLVGGLCPECKSSLKRKWPWSHKRCVSPECDWEDSNAYRIRKSLREL